jgi:pimeloyl-ACP methyl ester carboxylesterase
VSPYNLWSVRFLRYLTVLFLIITFLWWVLLFISIFISPPHMHSRGSGYFDVSYALLTMGNLLVALLFFATPSTPMSILALAVSVMLMIDMILILAVSHVRAEEGWVGIASVVWAALMSLYSVLTNKTVRWGKKEEEERLTGREETRRSLREWCAVLTATVIMIVLVAVTVLLTATLILRARDASLTPPGQRFFVDGDKYQIHIACVGDQKYDDNGKRLPTILVEGGEEPTEGSGLEDFMYNARENGTIDRYCYWDRPGLAFSDNAPSPHSAGMSIDALSEALAIANENGPWILVSAGIGSIYSRIFSSRHIRDVRGIFLIDGLHEDLLYKVGSPSRGFFLWAWGIISPLGLDRLPAAVFKGRTREDRVYGCSSYQNGKYLKAKLQENLVADSLTKNEVMSARNIQTPRTPLVVVSSGIMMKKDKAWEGKQEDLTKITDNLLSYDVVGGAPHEVWQTLEGRQVLEKRLGELLHPSVHKNKTKLGWKVDGGVTRESVEA